MSIVKNSGQYDQIYEKWFGTIDPKGISRKQALRYFVWGVSVFLMVGLALFLWSLTLKRQVVRRTKDLQESKERYRGVVEDTPVMICRFLPGGEIMFVNETYCRYFAKTSEELVGSNFLSFIPEADRETRMANISGLTVESPTQPHEHRVVAPGGDLRWQHWTYRALFDTQGKAIAYQSIGDDITERKQMEEALREAYNIINRSPAVAFLWKNDEGWPVEFVSDNVRELFGYTVKEFTSGQVLFSATVHRDDLERVAQEVATYSEEEDTKDFYHEPYRIITKDGKVKWLDDRTYIRRDNKGNITHYEGIVVDITERMQAAEALRKSEDQLRQAQKLESVGRLAGGVAHDFNNLLTTIIGYSELIAMEEDPNDTIKEGIQEIKNSAERAAALTQQLLAFSRKQVLQPQVIDLNRLVTRLGKMLKRLIGEDIDFTTELDANIGNIKAD